MSRKKSHTLMVAALFCAVLGLPKLYAQGQNTTNGEDAYDRAIANTYTHTNWFPNLAGPYLNPRVPPFRLVNSQDLYQLIQNGTLRLSLQDAIALAIENN